MLSGDHLKSLGHPADDDLTRSKALWIAVAGQASAGATPYVLFGKADDASWLWMNTSGYREHAEFKSILPSMPGEATQERFTGAVGDRTLVAGFRFYQLVRQEFKSRFSGKIGSPTILDFGCGWGRITRFFLKDTEDIWGVDCIPHIIEQCKRTNPWGKFKVIAPYPPMDFPTESLDLVYSYSVFSHLSEGLHQDWLLEFHRVLKPGGLMIVSTREREFIESCDPARGNMPQHLTELSNVFANWDKVLKEYDRGQYCHFPTGGGDNLDVSFYGETCIPKAYVLAHWTKHFEFLDYLDNRALDPQNVVVMRKPK